MKKFLIGFLLIIIGTFMLINETYKNFYHNREKYSNELDVKINNKYNLKNSLEFNDFAGSIEFVKSDKNEILIEGVANVIENDKKTVINSKNSTINKNTHIYILYDKPISVYVNDSVGMITGEMIEGSYFYIDDTVGKIKLIVPEEIDVKTDNLIGIVKRENVLINYSSNTKFYNSDFVGTIDLETK